MALEIIPITEVWPWWANPPLFTSNENIVPPAGGIQQHDHATQEPFILCHDLHLPWGYG